MLEKKSQDRPNSAELLSKFPSFVKTAYEAKLEQKSESPKRQTKLDSSKPEKILPLPLPPPPLPSSPLIIPKPVEKSPQSRDAQSVENSKRSKVGGGSPKAQVLKLNLPPSESVSVLNQASKIVRQRPQTAKSRQIQRRGSQLESKKIQSSNQSPTENLVIFSREHMKDSSSHRAHFQFVKRRPQSAKINNKLRPRFLDRQESPSTQGDISPLHQAVSSQNRRESTGAVIEFVKSPPPITLNSVKHSKLVSEENPSKINRICSQKLLPTYSRIQFKKEETAQNMSVREKEENGNSTKIVETQGSEKQKEELTPLKKCDTTSSPFTGVNTKSMADLNELINECFVKSTAVVVKEEEPKIAKAPIAVATRSEEVVGKLRLRKESNGYYARKIQDTSLNTTGRRDSLKRKAPGVSMLKQMYREQERKQNNSGLIPRSTETTRLNTSGLKTGNSIDFRYKSESNVHFYRADSKRISSHSHTCSRSSLISQTPQHTTSIAFYRHEGDKRAEETSRGENVLNYINRNLYSNQHQIMMEACKVRIKIVSTMQKPGGQKSLASQKAQSVSNLAHWKNQGSTSTLEHMSTKATACLGTTQTLKQREESVGRGRLGSASTKKRISAVNMRRVKLTVQDLLDS